MKEGKKAPDVERLGEYGHVWATEYKCGWTVFHKPHGMMAQCLTREQAERWIRSIMEREN